jgi:3-oxoacyl-[acyl-carrier-protein] synthase-3
MPPLAILAGLGSAVPEKVLSNHDLERLVDTSDTWIVERTGIRERRLVAPDEATSDLAIAAARRAMADARILPEEIDLVMVATATPDTLFPSTACLVQEALGMRRAAAFDLSAACSGFVYGLALAEGVIASGRSKAVLLIGAEALSRITNYRDRSTCVLFGDGAGAAVLRPSGTDETLPSGASLLSVFLGADGSAAGILSLPAGGSRRPATAETVAEGLHYIHMDGQEVFKFAVKAMVRAVREAVRAASLTLADIDLLIPHQANARIVDAAVRLLRVPCSKVFHTIETYGNMSSASIPVSLDEARRRGRLRPGDAVVLVAFGAGMTYAGAVLRWNETAKGGSAA